VTDSASRDGGPEGLRRLDNGLVAPSYVPLTDVATEVGTHLLTALGRARIAAYLDPAPDPGDERRRLFVASAERADARTIVAAAVRGLGTAEPESAEPPDRSTDPLEGVDTDAAFAELIADWHVDTVAAVRDAERQLRQEDAAWREQLVRPAVEEPVWLDDDHYIPPPPPPLPRLAAPTLGGIALLAASIVLLSLGGVLGLATDLTMFLGVAGVLVGSWILIMRLRDRPDEDDDDGAVI
jgi:hypothetical protein